MIQRNARMLFLLPWMVSVVLCSGSAANGQSLTLASPFSSDMVFQQQTDAAIWGKATPGEKVSIRVSWSGHVYRSVAGHDGRWTTRVRTPAAGGPHSILVESGSESIELDNVLSGEVWICSGQSNMQWKLRGFGLDRWREDVERATYPNIRYCQVAQVVALESRDSVKAQWSICDPSTAYGYSAVAFFFGRELHEELGVPIGLISVNWGGSTAEAWVAEETLRKELPEFNARMDEFPRIIEETGAVYPRGQKPPPGLNNRDPSVLYNGMIEPLVPFAMRGVIWYQGESNVEHPVQYRTLFPALIKDWRDRWGIGEFPFYYVQIAPFSYARAPVSSAYLREAQMMVLSVPNTGMAVTMDVGNPDNVHPRRKKPVAHRLALLALAKAYGRIGLVCSGPLYKGYTVEGDRVRLSFDSVGGGLVSTDGEALTHFTIAGDDRVFLPAEAVIEGYTVVVRADAVPAPKAVRYGWGSADMPNLSNKEGLPASSFRTDDWAMDDQVLQPQSTRKEP